LIQPGQHGVRVRREVLATKRAQGTRSTLELGWADPAGRELTDQRVISAKPASFSPIESTELDEARLRAHEAGL
jgi:hypothetical protein